MNDSLTVVEGKRERVGEREGIIKLINLIKIVVINKFMNLDLRGLFL